MAKTDPGNPIQVQNYLGGVDYPVGKQELLDIAKKNGAPEEVIKSLQGIADQEYRQPTDVTRQLGR